MALTFRIFCLLLFVPSVLLGQKPAFDYKTVQDGLAAEVTTCVFRDSRNLVWIGTQSGLQQYDGYRFRTFYPHASNPDQLRSGGIKAIVEDREGNLWIGTHNGGISRYLRQSDRFENYLPDSSAHGFFPAKGVNRLTVDDWGNVWILSPTELFRLTPGPAPVFTACHPWSYEAGEKKARLTAFGFDADHNLIVAIRGKGIARLSRDQLQADVSEHTWAVTADSLHKLFPTGIISMFSDSSQALWLGTGGGAWRIPGGAESLFSATDQTDFTAQSTFFDSQYFTPNTRLGARINQMEQTADGTLYFINPFGLYQYQPESQDFSFQDFDQLGIPVKGFNLIMNAHLDAAGLWWLATFEGLAVPKSGQAAFQQLTPTYEGPSMVRAVHEDRFGQVWVGLENGGVQIFEKNQTKAYLQLHLYNQVSEAPADFITSIWEDGPDQFWIGTYGGGLFSVQVRREADGRVAGITETAHLSQKDPTQLGTYYVYDLLRDQQGDFWVGGFDWLQHVEAKTGRVKRFALPVSNVVYQSSDQTIWIGTDRGLYYYDTSQDTVRAFVYEENNFQLSDQRIEDLVEGPDGTLWIGGIHGLFALDAQRKSLQRFGPGDGLSHLQIRGLAIDQAQHLWVMTLSGLCKRVGTQFVCYDYDSGLTNELYIARSISCSASGYLYAGGDNGVDLFHPDSIRSPHISGLFLDEMLLFNKPITVGQPSESGFTLPYSLNELELLELSHQERMVSFSFSGLGYKNQDQYRYAYQLEGFDPGWQEVPASRRIATYTNLPPGDYTFKVRAAAANGTWTEAKALAVVVHPPWWASWWARSLFWLMVGGIIYGLFSLRIRALRRELHVQQRINSAKEEERERVRAESAQDFHDQAGVQLSKLSLYSGVLRSWDTPDQPTDILDKMDANIRLLASSMKDFIWTLDQRQDQLLDLMVRINDVGKSLFDHSEIRFDFDFTIEQIEDMPVSTSIKRHLLLFCKEALNNSLKYSEAQHVQMKVQWLEVGKQLRLRLQDDGIGFQLGTLRRVNGLHIMEKRAKAMEGALTVDSVPGVGTLIQLDLPITPDGV